jgi:anti-sigma factor RsiW
MTPHLDDRLHDLLDGRLSAAERASAEAHLGECTRCRRELDALETVRNSLRDATAAPAKVPHALRTSVIAMLDRETARPPRGRYLGLVAAALLVVIAAALLWWQRTERLDLPKAVIADLGQFERGEAPLDVRSTDAAEIERYFASRGVPSRVFDLAMMQFTLEGGRVHAIDDRRSAFFVYRGAGGELVICQMFAGTTAELPPNLPRRENEGIVFHIAERDGATAVFWQEGPLVCVLTSKAVPREELVQLAFAKAMKV